MTNFALTCRFFLKTPKIQPQEHHNLWMIEFKNILRISVKVFLKPIIYFRLRTKESKKAFLSLPPVKPNCLGQIGSALRAKQLVANF
jgi:hypothetical protein